VTDEQLQRLRRLLDGLTQVGEGMVKCHEQFGALVTLGGELLTAAQRIMQESESR
jgi:hypothetical protein